VLIVQELSARLGTRGTRRALSSVSFELAPGEILAVLGPNGSGKSTLLRLLAGLAPPHDGRVAWGEVALSTKGRVLVAPGERGVGLLMQQAVLFPHLRVDENVALGLGPDVPQEQRAPRVAAALARARVSHLARAAVHGLSGGEAQRVALARALAQQPRVMLLDEPFHSLDSPVRAAIVEDLRALVRELGLAVVLVTHDGDEAATIADRVLLLRDGRTVQLGTLDELYRAPVDAFAARFLGDVTSIDAALARAAGVRLPAAFEGPTAWFRPEAVVLEPADATSPEAADEAGLVVLATRRRRALTEITVALPGGAPLLAHVHGDTSITAGGRVRARIAWLLPAPVAEP
jgi:ABC-type sulfate/molybdate transport systems ATPase subunit